MISTNLSRPGQVLAFLVFVFLFPPLFSLSVERWLTLVDYATPTSTWVEFREIRIPDFVAGTDPLMQNERVVYKTILVDYAAEITDMKTGVEVCQGGGKGIQMQPTPADIWHGRVNQFMQNDCATFLGPGRYYVEMTLCFRTNFDARRCLTRTSKPFEITP